MIDPHSLSLYIKGHYLDHKSKHRQTAGQAQVWYTDPLISSRNLQSAHLSPRTVSKSLHDLYHFITLSKS